MDVFDRDAVLAFVLDSKHGVTCSEVRQLRDEEAASEAEVLERWFDDGRQSNFEKNWCSNVDASQPDHCSDILE